MNTPDRPMYGKPMMVIPQEVIDEAWRLRRLGWSYRAIADELGVTLGSARRAWGRAVMRDIRRRREARG